MSIDSTLIVHHNRKSYVSEAYRSLRTNVMFSSNFKMPAVIAVTSTGPSEGKTLTTANLALAFSQTKHKTIVIDCDMRKPSIHNLFGISRLNGISTLLERKCELNDAIQNIEEIGIDVIASGSVSEDPTELLSTKDFKGIVDELKTRYDVIIIDTPPVGILTDASLISTVADGVVFVIKEGAVRGRDFRRAKENLQRVGANIIGTVFNMIGISGDKGYGYEYRYGYRYGYGYNYYYGESSDAENGKKSKGKKKKVGNGV